MMLLGVIVLYVYHVSFCVFFFFSSRRRHTRYIGDWSSDVCSSDLGTRVASRSTHVRASESTGGEPFADASRAIVPVQAPRSEERRVGKECRARWARSPEKKKYSTEEHRR